MRTLKFRAFSKKYNEFISIGFSLFGETTCFNLIELWYIENKGVREGLLDLVLNDVVIDQFTGAKDFKGNDIYEGDIIEFDRREWGGDDNIHLVEWDNVNFEWCFGGGNASDMCWRTVLGNIHLNKELLNSK